MLLSLPDVVKASTEATNLTDNSRLEYRKIGYSGPKLQLPLFLYRNTGISLYNRAPDCFGMIPVYRDHHVTCF